MRFSNELKSGVVIIAAVAVAFIFFGKTVTIRQETVDLKTYFGYAGDLQKDAMVKFAGIEVGRVKEIKFVYEPETRVECILEIDAGAKVRTDSIAYIGTAGFVGDAYIGITRGSAEEFLKNGDAILSEDPLQMRLLMKKADDIASNLDETLIQIKGLVVDNRQNVDNIILNVESITENFKEFSEDLKEHPWKLMFKGE